MKVLVTGGTGVVGEAAVTALVRRGHQVRILSRHAERDAAAWPDGVEPLDGSVTDPAGVRGCAETCDAVLHLVGIIDEHPPERTFQRVNVDGTRQVVTEAIHAGVRRFVYVSSLGAERGESEYHRSKRAGEEITRTFPREWVIVRPGNVYGPGDDQVSLLLKMVRTLPVVPVIDRGEDPFQPIWAADVGEALAAAVERGDVVGETLEVAGPERTSMNDLVARFAEITGRRPLRLPVPGAVAALGSQLAEKIGIDLPVNAEQIVMVREHNVIDPPERNALVRLCDTPTPLDRGLRVLADTLPEQLPAEGIGSLKRKRFCAEIEGSSLTPEALLEHCRRNFAQITADIIDVGAEPASPTAPTRGGTTVTMALPLRGNVQVRLEELTSRSMTLMTLAGHPLAGAVRFLSEPRGSRVHFEVQVYDRAANLVDWLVMSTVGSRVQDASWVELVEKAVDASGGRAPNGVQSEIVTLDDEQAAKIDEWLRGLVTERKRKERAAE